MIHKALYILLLPLALVFCACSHEPERDYGDFLEAFVKNEGNKTLTYHAHDDSPLITLHANTWDDEAVPVGDRAVIRYTVTDKISNYEYNVRIDDYAKIFNDVLRQADAPTIAGFESTPITVTSLWRSGNYINLNSWVRIPEKTPQVLLVLDEATIEDAIPQVHLIYTVKGQEVYFERKCYASFDITNLWTRETCQAIDIHVNDPNGTKVFRFEK